jgi:hypothetical protein
MRVARGRLGDALGNEAFQFGLALGRVGVRLEIGRPPGKAPAIAALAMAVDKGADVGGELSLQAAQAIEGIGGGRGRSARFALGIYHDVTSG